MKTVLIIFTFFIEFSFSIDNMEKTLNHCCNLGKAWSAENKSCTITLSFPLPSVDFEHNAMCLTTVGACCLNSLREMQCNEGKLVGLENGTCYEKNQQGKNVVDFLMCCEICKIGIAVGSTQAICQSTMVFNNYLWEEVYRTCCSKGTTKVQTTSAGMRNNIYNTNKCSDGTQCTHTEKCVNTPKGFECHPRSTISIAPENLFKYSKKQNCDVGYAYDVYGKTCKDIDECTKQPCDINQICENTPGSFKCHCKTGFKLDNVTNACTDINECQLNLHTCQESQRCDNTVGSYHCVRFTGCGTGYTLDVESALCLDDDECVLKTDTCGLLGPNWTCTNTLGSFRCVKKPCTGPNCKVQGGLNNTKVNPPTMKCLRGYETDTNNKCIDVNECRSSNRCLKNQICINTNGSYYCLTKSKSYP